MSYSVLFTPKMLRAAKQIARKHCSLKADLAGLVKQLEANPKLGTALGNNAYKIRLAIRSKQRGKSGGARVISYVETLVLEPEESGQVVLLAIYDKSVRETMTEQEISALVKEYLDSKS